MPNFVGEAHSCESANRWAGAFRPLKGCQRKEELQPPRETPKRDSSSQAVPPILESPRPFVRKRESGGSRGLQAPERMPKKRGASAPGLSSPLAMILQPRQPKFPPNLSHLSDDGTQCPEPSPAPPRPTESSPSTSSAASPSP